MRISDWSSDVCSSDLHDEHRFGQVRNIGQIVLHAKFAAFGARRFLAALEPFGGAALEFLRQFLVEAFDAGEFLDRNIGDFRSEEHTSELQSLMRISYAAFCLKQNKQYKTNTRT